MIRGQWSVIRVRLAEEAAGEYRAVAGGSFGYAQDDEREWSVVGSR